MIQPERIQVLNPKPPRNGNYVLYWMQASVRAEYNHALEFAVSQANKLHKPLVAYFGLTDAFPEANLRHYYFMIEGLLAVRSSLAERGIRLVILRTSPDSGAQGLSKDSCLTVVDRGYLKLQKLWRRRVADTIECPLVMVESDVVVPLEEASPKEEYAAATFRPKFWRKADYYLAPLEPSIPQQSSLDLDPGLQTLEAEDVEHALGQLNLDRSVGQVTGLHGSYLEATKHLASFIENNLERFEELRNDPSRDFLSNMSPYLHFGQISPLDIARKVMATDSPGKKAFLEELLVRRELSMNYVYYNDSYDSFDGMPDWAKNSLMQHASDPREYIYSLDELENADTHDVYWNAAQKQMMITGKMHGYMRMYWGKKILEWSRGPEEAFNRALHLNNKYELDGRDPNSFTGVAWCFGKHDRAWGERPVFGKVRYMNANGLRRKFDIDSYVRRIEALEQL